MVGYDPRLHSPDALERLKAAAAKAGAELKPVSPNPLDEAWGAARPGQPTAPVVPQPLDYSGEDSAEKRARVGAAIAGVNADAAVLTAPSSIAWLFNVRGGDVIRSPLPLGQAILNRDGTARLFLDPAKVTEALPAWLGNQVTLETPDDLAAALADLKGKRVMIDPAQSSAWYFEALRNAGAEVVRGDDPCALPRACKNATELKGTTEAHRRDGAALARFLHWLATDAQTTLPDEVEVVTRLENFREATGALKDLSFDTIAGAADGSWPGARTMAIRRPDGDARRTVPRPQPVRRSAWRAREEQVRLRVAQRRRRRLDHRAASQGQRLRSRRRRPR